MQFPQPCVARSSPAESASESRGLRGLESKAERKSVPIVCTFGGGPAIHGRGSRLVAATRVSLEVDEIRASVRGHGRSNIEGGRNLGAGHAEVEERAWSSSIFVDWARPTF